MEFAVLDSYFQNIAYPFTKHHIDSFHNMFKTHIPNTIQSYNPIVMIKEDADSKKEIIRVEMYIGNPTTEGGEDDDEDADDELKKKKKDSKNKIDTGLYVDRPTYLDQDGNTILMLPQEARLRNLTYATKLYADVTVKYFTDPSNLPDNMKEDLKEGDPFAIKTFPKTIIGRIPIMLHSDQCALHNQGSKVLKGFGECPMDPGGYFIVDGKEKVIVSQERIVTNRLFVSKLDDKYFSYRGYIHCTGASGETALSPRSVEFVLLKKQEHGLVTEDDQYDKKKGGGAGGGDEDENEEASASANGRDNKHYKKIQGAILVSLPSIKGRLPLTTVFRAFGIVTDKQIVEAICGPIEDNETYNSYLNFLRPSIAHTGPINSKGVMQPIWTTEDAIEALKDRVYFESIQHLKTIIASDIFPNIEGSLADKGKYLGCLVGTFMRVSLGLLPESDRDSFIYKRIDVSGMLLSQLFQETYIKFRNGIRDRMDQRYYWNFKKKDVWTMSNIVDINSLSMILHGNPSDQDYDVITTTMQKSLKGMWGPPVSDPELGKVQDLSRVSYIGTLSHLRRVNNDLDRSIKITSPHRLHSQQWGIICPFESPDGASIGYLKNFALLTQVTFDTSSKSVIAAIHTIDVGSDNKNEIVKPIADLSASFLARKDAIKIFINGSLYGVTIDPVYLVNALRAFRRNGLLDPFISVTWNIKENEIRINTDAGRPCRPLFIVKNSHALIDKYTMQTIKGVSWTDLLLGKLDKSIRTANKDEFISPYDAKFNGRFTGKKLNHILEELEKSQGCIEYLDIEEENTMLIAMKREDLTKSEFYTHLEIHPSTALSVVTNIVPFANHNQAPRVYFHGAQSKQAVGIYATNWHKRFDTAGYIQHYPQKRIISTRGSHYNGNNMMPNGCNVIVAIMTHTGFNQEDSIMINRRAIDRGLFQMTAYKTMTASEKTLSPTERVIFANPKKMQAEGTYVAGLKKANYTLIGGKIPQAEVDDADEMDEADGDYQEGGADKEMDGIIREEAYIPRDQKAVIIGMVHITQQEKQVKNGVFTDRVLQPVYKDVSVTTDVNHYGKVDRVFVGKTVPTNEDRICKVRFRKVRRPEPGNKFCSAHGQKGVIGMILEQENMPFTKDGVVPDLIINPHALPSRMTMGHLIETVFAKLCCMEGCYGDGTVFIPFDREVVFDGLSAHKFERYGNEMLYDGRTGRQIETSIFMGPIYYYQLKHMVVDKVQSRGIGEVKRVQLTHQPTAGRSAGGGLRIGEMERDVLIGHGISGFIRECMMEKADKYKWAVCRHCGTIAEYNPKAGILGCRGCNRDDVAVIETPWAMKLLIQELEAVGVQLRLSTEPVPEEDEFMDDETGADPEDDDDQDDGYVDMSGGLDCQYANADGSFDAENAEKDCENSVDPLEQVGNLTPNKIDGETSDCVNEKKREFAACFDRHESEATGQELTNAALEAEKKEYESDGEAEQNMAAPPGSMMGPPQGFETQPPAFQQFPSPSQLPPPPPPVAPLPPPVAPLPPSGGGGGGGSPSVAGSIAPSTAASEVKTIRINLGGGAKHEPRRGGDEDYDFEDDADNEFLSS
jgi:DNA-directed RNA polymerase II subunit RPB2